MIWLEEEVSSVLPVCLLLVHVVRLSTGKGVPVLTLTLPHSITHQ